MLERDRVTQLAYLMLGVWGFLLYALGPALPALRRDLDVSRSAVSLHTTLVALGAIAVGAVGERMTVRLGRRRAFWVAAGGIAVGALALAGGRSLAVTLPAAAVLGFAGASSVMLVQSTLADRHGPFGAAAIVEANAVATGLGAAAPFVVALAIIAGSSWRAVFVGAAVLVLPALTLAYRSVTFPLAIHHEEERGRLPRAYWLHWTALLLFVAVEFSIALWSTDYFETEHRLSPSAAAASASLFLVGMTCGRIGGAVLARRVAPERILAGALTVAAGGFALFWLVGLAAVAVAGLAVAGLGIALLYPLTLALALDVSAGRTDAASARAAFASGLAIALAPFALGSLADQAGLVAAYAIVPVLLAGGLVTLRAASRATPGRARADGERVRASAGA